MEGITVLATVERTTGVFTWTTGAVIALLIFVIIGFCIVAIIFAIREWDMLLLLLPLVAFGASIVSIAGYTKVEDDPHYKIIIDERASYSDITSRYEIIDQEGLILTVKERVNEEEADSN